MSDITNTIKKIEVGLGVIALSISSVEGQKIGSYSQNKNKEHNYSINCPIAPFERYDRKAPTVKLGGTYNIVKREAFSDRGPGIEVLLEYDVMKRFFAELEVGICSLDDFKARNGAIHYSDWHTNVGFGYRLVIRDGWTIGGKLATGLSDEFYKELSGARTQEWHWNKLVELCLEKKIYKMIGLGGFGSREFDRDMWRMGVRLIIRPETFKTRNVKHHNFPIKNTIR